MKEFCVMAILVAICCLPFILTLLWGRPTGPPESHLDWDDIAEAQASGYCVAADDLPPMGPCPDFMAVYPCGDPRCRHGRAIEAHACRLLQTVDYQEAID